MSKWGQIYRNPSLLSVKPTNLYVFLVLQRLLTSLASFLHDSLVKEIEIRQNILIWPFNVCFLKPATTAETPASTTERASVMGPYEVKDISYILFIITFSHFHWLNVLRSWGSENTRLTVCLCVSLSVCLSVPVWRNNPVDFNETFQKGSL